MQIPEHALILTKDEAAARQVEAAIEALVRGHFDVAITLAGAAEDMIEREGPHLFQFLRDHPKAQAKIKAEWISVLNRERNWLKHSCGPQTMRIERYPAAIMTTLFFFTAPVLALSQAEKDAAGDACVDAYNACDGKCEKKWDPSRFRPGTKADLYSAKVQCRASCTSRLNKCVKDIAVRAPNHGAGSSGGAGASRK